MIWKLKRTVNGYNEIYFIQAKYKSSLDFEVKIKECSIKYNNKKVLTLSENNKV